MEKWSGAEEDVEERGLCFVVMPFADSFTEYYKGIYEPAIQDAGLEPRRADSLFRPSSIITDMWELTRKAELLLVDMTGKNPNVFYELGLAHAIAKPAVLVASSIDDVPFDLRGLRCLIYECKKPFWGEDLRRAITRSLQETLADPNSAIPPTFLGEAPPTRPQEDPVMLELMSLRSELKAMRAGSQRVVHETAHEKRFRDVTNFLTLHGSEDFTSLPKALKREIILALLGNNRERALGMLIASGMSDMFVDSFLDDLERLIRMSDSE